jgi:hypothetical protein
MAVSMHFTKALEIQQREPDWTRWGPMIDALTPEEQEIVRPYLRMQARIAKKRQQDTNSTPKAASVTAWKQPRKR